MNDPQEKSSLLPISGVMLALALLGGSLFLDTPFHSLRKPAAKMRPTQPESLQSIDSRLWQDPLTVVQDHRPIGSRINQIRPHHLMTLAAEIDRLAEQRHSLHILLATMPSAPYAEAGETRRRKRYAIISGLSVAGFKPEDAEHLGYFEYQHIKPTKIYKIPYEWFVKSNIEDSTIKEKALLLWLDESFLSGEPRRRLQRLTSYLMGFRFMHELEAPYPPCDLIEQGRVVFYLLGPDSSDGLLALLQENQKEGKSKVSKEPDGFKKAEKGISKDTKTADTAPSEPPGSMYPSAPALAQELCGDFVANFKNQEELLIDSKKVAWKAICQDCQETLSEFIKNQQHPIEHGFEALTKNLSNAIIQQKITTLECNLTAGVTQSIRDWVTSKRPVLYGRLIESDSFAPKIRIYSSYATAAPHLLFDAIGVGKANVTTEDLERKIVGNERVFSSFDSTISSDEKLAELLLHELRYRNVHQAFWGNSFRKYVSHRFLKFRSKTNQTKGTEKKSAIILIAESDTFYGRSIYKTFAKENVKLKSLFKIERMSYLRGLDGVLPSNSLYADNIKSQRPTNGRDQAQEYPLRSKSPQIEQSFGTGQFDYLRRLAKRLVEAKRRGENIIAIGVVGTDTYDVLLTLQALRPNFPNAALFTTDLDSRLFHHSQLGWTRNLIVASGHGLRLHRKLQKDIPPFRDAYQTATFLATLKALDPGNKRLESATLPQLFEIGFNGAVSLNHPPSMKNEQLETKAAPVSASFWEPLTDSGIFYFIMMFFGIIGLVRFMPLLRELISSSTAAKQTFKRARPIFLRRYEPISTDGLCLNYRQSISIRISNLIQWFRRKTVSGITLTKSFQSRFKKYYKNNKTAFIFVALAHIGVVGLIYLIALAVDDHNQGEPFTLLDGVSAWLSILWTWIILFFGIAFLIIGKDIILKNNRFISDNFFTHSRNQSNKSKGFEIWAKYCSDSNKHFNSGWFIVFCIFFLSMIFLSPFNQPIRGDRATFIHYFLFSVSGVVLTLLTLVAIEQTLRCGKFINDIAIKNITWGDFLRSKLNPGVSKKHHRFVDDYLDVRIVALCTEASSKLIIYPFLFILLFFLGYQLYFDNWSLPGYVYAMFGVLIIYSIHCGLFLRRAAEKARTESLRQLVEKRRLFIQEVVNSEERKELISDFDFIRGKILSEKRGTFAPWSRQPVVRAVLAPLGGLGSLAAFEYFFLMMR